MSRTKMNATSTLPDAHAIGRAVLSELVTALVSPSSPASDSPTTVLLDADQFVMLVHTLADRLEAVLAPTPEAITIAEAARRLSIGATNARRMFLTGEIPGLFRPAGRHEYLVRWASVQEWVREQEEAYAVERDEGAERVRRLMPKRYGAKR